jgi:hypothetical protein
MDEREIHRWRRRRTSIHGPHPLAVTVAGVAMRILVTIILVPIVAVFLIGVVVPMLAVVGSLLLSFAALAFTFLAVAACMVMGGIVFMGGAIGLARIYKARTGAYPDWFINLGREDGKSTVQWDYDYDHDSDRPRRRFVPLKTQHGE